MATFSQGFLANLGRPAMTESLFDLGTAIGGLPGQYKEGQKKDAFNSLMRQAQNAMTQNNAAELSRISQELAQLGFVEDAQKLTEASKAATRRQQSIDAGQAALSENYSAMQEAAKDLAGQGRLEESIALQDRAKSVAQTKGKKALQVYASQEGINLDDKKAQEGFFRIASAYGLENESKDLLDNFRGVSDKTTFGTEVTLRDSEGNLFTRRIAYDKTGSPREIITPIGNSPSNPVGGVTVISSTTGASAFDKPGIAAETVLETEYSKLRNAAIDSLPGLESALSVATKSLDLLDKINTGGVTTAMIRGAQNWLGVQPRDEAEFEFYAGQAVLDGLKNFKGSISEGERTYLENMYYSLLRSNFANKAQLEVLVRDFAKAIENAQLRADSKTFDDYNEKLKARRERSSKTKNQREGSWADLRKG